MSEDEAKCYDTNLAHEGDAIVDAILFDRDQCKDRSIYRELYGLQYRQVLYFRTYTNGLFKIPCQELVAREALSSTYLDNLCKADAGHKAICVCYARLII